MAWIDLGNPEPRDSQIEYHPIDWPSGESRKLTTEVRSTGRAIDVLVGRYTKRSFNQISENALGQLLCLTNQVRNTGPDKLGFTETSRPAPSGGAIHPIHLILQPFGEDKWYRHEPVNHELIEVCTDLDTAEVRASMEAVLPGEHATLILFVAETGMTESKYSNASSLIWRDSGVLQGYMSVAAEALGLNFCLLGITGEPWASQLLKVEGLAGVGAAYVGS